MASSLQKLVQASKQNVENVIQLRKEFAEKAAQVVDKAGKKKAFRQKTLISSNARFSGLSKNGRVSAGQSFFILSTAFKHNGFDLTGYRR